MTLDHETIRKRLNNVFCDVFDDDKLVISNSTNADDIDEWDSLMHITLVVATENEFDIRLNAAEVGKLEDVGGMINLILDRKKI